MTVNSQTLPHDSTTVPFGPLAASAETRSEHRSTFQYLAARQNAEVRIHTKRHREANHELRHQDPYQ